MNFESTENNTPSFKIEEEALSNQNQEASPSFVKNSDNEENIESLKQEINHLKDQWLRAVADLENHRKRAQKAQEEATKYAITHFARDVLSLPDNLRRALESCPDVSGLPETLKAFVAGVKLTESELLKTLDKYHIKRLAPLHENFDPYFHQAMVEIETTEHPAGVVVQVFQAGYILHDRLLRPALVGVSKMPANGQESNADLSN